MSPFVFTNLLKKLHQQLVNWIIFSAIVVCLLNYNTVITTNGTNKASKHVAGYSKYVLLVCTYLNANVNERLVIIREGLAIWHHTSGVCCRGCNNSNIVCQNVRSTITTSVRRKLSRNVRTSTVLTHKKYHHSTLQCLTTSFCGFQCIIFPLLLLSCRLCYARGTAVAQ